jgi:hypothetical protein
LPATSSPVTATSTTTSPATAASASTSTSTSIGPASSPAPLGGPSSPCAGTAAAPGRYDHVVWIWMENHQASQVIGSAAAPYLTGLARACGTVARYEAVGSPSLPNYLGATSGDIQGVHDDGAPSSHTITVDNLFRQVRASGGTARSFEEAMPGTCATAGSGRYAVKHNPAAYYVGGDDRAACQGDDVPLGTLTTGALAADLDAGTLPAFAFVTPDLCNDTHDCDVATGDRWLAQWVPRLVASASYRAGRTAVFVVWDEPTPMPFLALAPSIVPGSVGEGRFDHYALLRTTEELLGLPLLGRAASAASLRGPLRL